MRSIYIATEDELSETVAERLIQEANHELRIAVRVRRNGNTFLKAKLPELIKTSLKIPVFLLTDLDRAACPVELINEWIKGLLPSKNMVIRVAVREVESWLLADRHGFSGHTGIPVEKITHDPDSLSDPKLELLNLVRRYGRKNIRSALLPGKGSSAKIGWEYNSELCVFVRDVWSVKEAVIHSESLRRALARLRRL